MKKKKYLLSIGTIGAIVAPIAATISCGKKGLGELYPDNGGANGYLPTFPSVQKDITREKLDFTALKDFITNNQSDYPDLTIANLNKITPEDLHNYSNNVIIDPLKTKVISQSDAAILKFSFKNNINPTNIGSLLNFVNSEALTQYTISNSRGPWRSEASHGSASYYQKDLFTPASVNAYSDLSLLDSQFTPKGVTADPSRTLIKFNSLASGDRGERVLDWSFHGMTSTSNAQQAAAIFSLFRTKVTGKNVSSLDQKTGIRTWSESQVQKPIVTEGVTLEVGNASKPDGASFTSDASTQVSLDDAQLVASLNDANNDRLTFKINNNQFYVQPDSNGKIVKTNIPFKAKDLFYGFVRNLYASVELREKGTINGKHFTGLDKFSDSEISDLQKQFDSIESYRSNDALNMYLYDLYNIDLEKTIAANNNDDTFTLVFKTGSPITSTALNCLLDANTVSPVPSTIIDQRFNALPSGTRGAGSKYGYVNYGIETTAQGAVTSTDNYAVGSYVITRYSNAENDSVTLESNPYFVGGILNNTLQANNIKTYKIVMKSASADASAFANTRLSNFKDNASATHEYMLDESVKSEPSLMDKVSSFAVYAKPNRVDALGTFLQYNNYISPSVNESVFNDFGRKMMWGESDINKINTSSDALDYFYNQGAMVRASINAAINWYSVAQLYYPGVNKEFYGSMIQEDSLDISGITNHANGYPLILDSGDEMQKVYSNNQGDQQTALMTSKTLAASWYLNKLATEAGATPEHPAKLPIFSYSTSDNPETAQQKDSENQIKTLLNKLTPKVQFDYFPPATWTDLVNSSMRQRTAFITFAPFGPDYPGVGSIIQQFISTHASASGVELIKMALNPLIIK